LPDPEKAERGKTVGPTRNRPREGPLVDKRTNTTSRKQANPEKAEEDGNTADENFNF